MMMRKTLKKTASSFFLGEGSVGVEGRVEERLELDPDLS